MKKLLCMVIIYIITQTLVFSQYKTDLEQKDNVYESLTKSSPSLILGFFNPENFTMKHSYSFVYSMFGSSGIGLGTYTNSMAYKFADNLNAKVDLSVTHSPFGSYNKNLTDKFTGIYLDRAEINYKPWENVHVQVQYRQLPSYLYYSPYSAYSSRYYNPFFGVQSDDSFFMNR
jgi:hypothetical protein